MYKNMLLCLMFFTPSINMLHASQHPCHSPAHTLKLALEGAKMGGFIAGTVASSLIFVSNSAKEQLAFPILSCFAGAASGFLFGAISSTFPSPSEIASPKKIEIARLYLAKGIGIGLGTSIGMAALLGFCAYHNTKDMRIFPA